MFGKHDIPPNTWDGTYLAGINVSRHEVSESVSRLERNVWNGEKNIVLT